MNKDIMRIIAASSLILTSCVEGGTVQVLDPDKEQAQEQESCTDGEISCPKSALKICENGRWIIHACPNGCNSDGKSCAESQQPPVDNPPVDNPPVDNPPVDNPPEDKCTNGDVVCEGDVLKTCEDGTWTTKTCQNGCINNQCAACKNDTTRCENDVESICQNGEWHKKLDCQYGCQENGQSCDSVNQMQPTRYLMKRAISPITPYVVEQMKKIAAKNPNTNSNVFMKVGDSHYDYTFDGCFMKCFSDNTSSAVTLDSHTELKGVIDAFQKTKDSFNRNSLSAIGGKSTPDVNGGANSKIYQEIAAMNPRFGFFGHGANDLGNGSFVYTQTEGFPGYPYAIQEYYRQMNRALDQMISKGVVPLISGIAPNFLTPSKINFLSSTTTAMDKRDYPRYVVQVFDSVSRGIAEARQLPWFDVYHTFFPLEGHGLRSDHAHGSTSGSPCNFTAEGLKYGVNARNLGSIQMLNSAWQTVVNGVEANDPIDEPFRGTGAHDDPYLITSIPFTHSGDMTKSTFKRIDAYGGTCLRSNGGTYPEGGAEYYYKLELKEKKRVKIYVASGRKYTDSGVVATYDMDLQVLKNTPDADSCLVRSDIFAMGTLEAGTYYFVVDTYGESGAQTPGDYLFGIVECDNYTSSGESAQDYDYDKRCDEPLKAY